MSSTASVVNSYQRFYANDGVTPLSGGFLTFYENETTTLISIYSDPQLTVAQTNPDYELDAGGRIQGDVRFAGTASILIKDSAGATVRTDDNNVCYQNAPAFGVWDSTVTYADQDIVRGSDDLYYISIVNNNINNDPAAGASPTQWTQIKFIRVWNTNETYAIADIVRGSNGKLYRCLVSQSGNNPTTDETNWLPIGSPKYDSTTNYFIGDIAQDSNNEFYQSIDDTNADNDPSGTAAKWTQARYILIYNANQTYAIGDIVQDSTGKLWRSLTGANTGNTPSSSPTNWAAAVDSSGASSVIRSARTSNTILGTGDNSRLIDITANTFTQTFDAAATLESGWFVYIRNSGTGDITLDPNGAETIDGLTTFVMYPGEVRLVQSDGTNLNSIVVSPFRKSFTASGTFTKPPGYKTLGGMLWSGGSSGERTNNVGILSTGGGGGGAFPFTVVASDVGTTETVTIGAGGAAVTTVASGNVGGTSSFGSLFQVRQDTVPESGGAVSDFTTNQAHTNSATGSAAGFEAANAAGGGTGIYGGGSAATDASANSGSSVYGGGAGGGLNASATLRAAGGSDHGGVGGAANSTGNGH